MRLGGVVEKLRVGLKELSGWLKSYFPVIHLIKLIYLSSLCYYSKSLTAILNFLVTL